jgi:hypothetical protein
VVCYAWWNTKGKRNCREFNSVCGVVDYPWQLQSLKAGAPLLLLG